MLNYLFHIRANKAVFRTITQYFVTYDPIILSLFIIIMLYTIIDWLIQYILKHPCVNVTRCGQYLGICASLLYLYFIIETEYLYSCLISFPRRRKKKAPCIIIQTLKVTNLRDLFFCRPANDCIAYIIPMIYNVYISVLVSNQVHQCRRGLSRIMTRILLISYISLVVTVQI